MLSTVSHASWMQIARGCVAIVFGVVALAWPGITLIGLLLVFGVYVIASGAFALGLGFRQYGAGERWWPMLLLGIAGIVAGVLAFSWPAITWLVLMSVIAVWAIVSGILDIVSAIRLRHEMTGEWRLVVAGVLAILFGLAIATYPVAGTVAMIWLVGIFAIVTGIFHLLLGFQLQRVEGALKRRMAEPGERAA